MTSSDVTLCGSVVAPVDGSVLMIDLLDALTFGVTSSANAGVPTAARVIAVVAAMVLIVFFAIKFSFIAIKVGLAVKSNLVICSITRDLSAVLPVNSQEYFNRNN